MHTVWPNLPCQFWNPPKIGPAAWELLDKSPLYQMPEDVIES